MRDSKQITKVVKAGTRQLHGNHSSATHYLPVTGPATSLYLSFCICNTGRTHLVPTSSCCEKHNENLIKVNKRNRLRTVPNEFQPLFIFFNIYLYLFIYLFGCIGSSCGTWALCCGARSSL